MSVNKAIKIYRLPGMGADCRLYSEIKPIKGFVFVDIEWEFYPDIESLKEYALKVSSKINVSEPFCLMGISMGGMVCSELTDLLNPLKTILISSAKSAQEIPPYLKKLKNLPFDKLITPLSVKKSIPVLPLTLGKIDDDKLAVLKDMVLKSDVRFLQFAAKAITNWKKNSYAKNKIAHIHGTADKVLPVKYINNADLIENGSHLMVWSKAQEVNNKIQNILSDINL
jgi:pimeloyl-ACP methyl ester carboxylesterase